MKISHIIGIVAIAVAIGILVISAGDASHYTNFKEALSLSRADHSDNIHVIGTLKKDVNGDVIGIRPGGDKVSFSFLMIDENETEEEVFFNSPMPQDFVKSEKVVVVGGYKNDKFLAEKILLKCPSKYEEEQSFSAKTGE